MLWLMVVNDCQIPDSIESVQRWLMWQQRQRKSQMQLLSAIMSLCLLLRPVVSAWCHNSFADKYYLLLQMSTLSHRLVFYFSWVRMLFPVVPMALLLCTKPNRALVLLSVPVTCSLSCSLYLYLSLSPPFSPAEPPCISLLKLTIEAHGETCMFASGRGVKRGVENKEQDWQRDTTHLNACL